MSAVDSRDQLSSGGPVGRRPQVLSGREVGPQVVDRVVRHALADVEGAADGGEALIELVHETIYCEQRRLAQAQVDPRTARDRAFLAQLRHELAHARDFAGPELVRSIVEKHEREIAGHFDRRVYAFATRVLPHALGALLGGPPLRESLFDVENHVLLEGELDGLRAAARNGTVILVPTHSSNLDSLLVGWAIYRLGLPPFAYAAGLNLYTNPVLGFFMRNLGAYSVDRKKTDPLYGETLREHATTLLERGQHGLCFPGGTRSRSGHVESHLKLGLLGTVPVAFRRALERTRPRPRIFVVPCTVTYPLVLEASSLVEDFLRHEGGAHYVDLSDEFDQPRRWFDFLRGLHALELRVHVRFGQPLDPVGNDVDVAGRSLDPHGREVDIARYFMAGGALTADDARDAEYTRNLGARIVRAYHRDTVAIPTSVVAFAIFERLRRTHSEQGLFRLLRRIGPEDAVAASDVGADVARLLAELFSQCARDEIRMSPELLQDSVERIVERALKTFATYHVRPVVERRGKDLVVLDPNLLFYYRNRLDGRHLLAARPAS